MCLKAMLVVTGVGLAASFFSASVQAACPVTNTFSNGSVADATQVNQNFSDLTTCVAPLANPNFSGSVGIGTASPNAPLQVIGGGPIAILQNTVSTAYGGLRVYNDLTSFARSLEIDYSGSSYPGHLLTGGPNGESASLTTTGAFPLALGTAGTARIVISSAGNVGIGTAVPIAPLHVIGSGQTAALQTTSSTAYAGMRIYNDLGLNNRTLEMDYASSSYPGQLLSGGPSGESAALTTTGAYSLALGTSNAARLVISSSGNVGIGTASPSYTLHVNGSVAGTSAYNNLSDARLKKDVEPIRDALAIVTRLNGVRFKWRSDKERQVGKGLLLPLGQTQLGFIAQDLNKVVPEAISRAAGPDAIMSVAESKVVPILVEAVKELEVKNESQAREISALQDQQMSQVTELKAELIAVRRQLNFRAAQN